jgi:hypothetical protein
MDKRHFDRLVKGVREMKRHMAGKAVRGVRVTTLAELDVRAIPEAAKISQSQSRRYKPGRRCPSKKVGKT